MGLLKFTSLDNLSKYLNGFDGFQIFLYALVIAGLVRLFFKFSLFFQRQGLPKLLSTSILCVTIIYLSAILPGIIGKYTTVNTYLVFLAIAFLVLIFLPASSKVVNVYATSVDTENKTYQLNFVDLVCLSIGAILCAPLLSYLRTLPFALVDPNPILGWDVVSYHLPGVIEFFQNRSLWSLSGPYQSYFFGYELIGNFFSQTFYASWGILLTHILSLFFVVAGMIVFISLFPQTNQYQNSSRLSSFVLAIGIWSTIGITTIGAVGKNDLFMGSTVLSALAFLLILGFEKPVMHRNTKLILFLIACSLGLAIGSKPTAIAFIPFFWIASIFCLTRQKKGNRDAITLASAAIILALVLGGFWLFRNLFIFGALSPVMNNGWNASIAANILNLRVYRDAIHFPAFLLASAAWIPALWLAHQYPIQSNSRFSWLLLGYFHLTSCLIFLITPFAYQNSGFEVRLGMPIILSAAIIYGLLVPLAIEKLLAFKKLSWTIGGATLILMLAIPMYWSAKKQNNLFGYDEMFPPPKAKKLPKTSVYTWVQEQKEPLRIYSAGLRPYGLYGRHWENKLFYDLHSSTLTPKEEGKRRIAAAVRQFSPDLILISIAPHSNEANGIKPEVLMWMKQRQDLFTEVFSDELVTGYRVRPEAKQILANEFPASYSLKMGE